MIVKHKIKKFTKSFNSIIFFTRFKWILRNRFTATYFFPTMAPPPSYMCFFYLFSFFSSPCIVTFLNVTYACMNRLSHWGNKGFWESYSHALRLLLFVVVDLVLDMYFFSCPPLYSLSFSVGGIHFPCSLLTHQAPPSYYYY